MDMSDFLDLFSRRHEAFGHADKKEMKDPASPCRRLSGCHILIPRLHRSGPPPDIRKFFL